MIIRYNREVWIISSSFRVDALDAIIRMEENFLADDYKYLANKT